MLNQDTYDFLIKNIHILKFTLIILPLVLITLIVWELGFFDAKRKTTQSIPLEKDDKKAGQALSPPQPASAPAAEEQQEEYDPFKILLQQGSGNSEEVQVVEAEVLDTIEKKNEKKEKVTSVETIDLGAYMQSSADEPQQSAGEKEFPAQDTKKEEVCPPSGLREVMENTVSAEQQNDDPWKVLIAKSVEADTQSGSHPSDAKKTIKIDLGELKEEEK